MFVLRAEKVTIFAAILIISSKMVTFSARNTNLYKICKLRRAICSVFCYISPPNFAILLILGCSSYSSTRFRSSCLVRPLVYYANNWSIMQIIGLFGNGFVCLGMVLLV